MIENENRMLKDEEEELDKEIREMELALNKDNAKLKNLMKQIEENKV